MANYQNLVIDSAHPTGLGSGDVARNTTILAGGLLTLDGAAAYDTLVSGAGAYLAASNGAELSATSVTAGGLLEVISPSGVVAATKVSGAGFFYLTGGSASGTELAGNCIERVSGGASEIDTKIGADAIQEVHDATVSGATVSGVGLIEIRADGRGYAVATSAGHQMLGSGARALDTVVSAYGIQAVSSGAVAVGVRIENYGQQQVLAGGVVSCAVMSSGTTEYQATYQLVEGTAYDTVVYAYGDHYVRHGGVTYRSEIHDLAWQTVAAGGTASGTVILSGGLQGIYAAADGYSRGEAYDTTVKAGGVQAVESGYAERTTVFGTQEVWDLGTAAETTVSSGGWQTVCGTALGNTIHSGGKQEVRAGNNGGQEATPGYASGNTFSGGEQWVTGIGVAEDNVFYGGSQFLQAGSAVNNRLYQATQYVENAFVLSTVIVGGTQNLVGATLASQSVISQGVMFVNPGASASGARLYGGAHHLFGGAADVELRDGAALHVWEGGTLDGAVIDAGASCNLYDGSLWSGSMTVAGQVSRLGGNAGHVDLTFRITGGRPAGYMLNLNSPEATYAISVSRDAECGTRVLINDLGTLAQQSFALGTAAAGLGTLALGETARFGNREYLLESVANQLRFTVSGGEAESAGADVNGDGRSDLVMTHTVQGFAGAWLIGEDQTASWGDLSTMGTGWSVFGLGHAAAGSCADVYLHDGEGNTVGAWLVGDDGKVAGWETVGQFDTSTNVLGLGDFNGDGQTDLLLRNDNGAVGCYFTSGETLGWNYFQSLGDEWTVAAVGDLNGDGRDDVVLKHDAGFAGSWLTQSDYTMAWADLDTLAEGFGIAGCGDFNGDGVDDVLLRTGDYFGAWIVEDGSAKGWMGLGTLNAGTELEEIGDFNGDGVDDLRVRSSAGDLGALCVVGDGKLEWHYYGSVGAEWTTSLAASV